MASGWLVGDRIRIDHCYPIWSTDTHEGKRATVIKVWENEAGCFLRIRIDGMKNARFVAGEDANCCLERIND